MFNKFDERSTFWVFKLLQVNFNSSDDIAQFSLRTQSIKINDIVQSIFNLFIFSVIPILFPLTTFFNQCRWFICNFFSLFLIVQLIVSLQKNCTIGLVFDEWAF